MSKAFESIKRGLREAVGHSRKRSVERLKKRLSPANPRKLISIRLPEGVIRRWRATGPGWQTRMAERLTKLPPK